MKELTDKFNALRGKKVLVLGDLMLDSYVFGSVDRISPEAPVPILNVKSEETRLGGAANTALNISSLGGKPLLAGFVGLDTEGRKLFSLLKKNRISSSLVLKSPDRRTTLKLRAMEKNHLLRIDYENTSPLNPRDEKRLIALLKSQAKKVSAIVVSDYVKGVITKRVLEELRRIARKHRLKVIVDPKPRSGLDYSGFYLTTPNEIEALEFAGKKKASIEELGKILAKKTKSNVLITRGPKGMALFEGKQVLNFPTQAKEVFDVSGAGDTVTAILGLAAAGNFSLEESCILANAAAGLVVGKMGTASVSLQELKREFEREEEKVKPLNELKRLTLALQKKGKKIVFTSGCFDLIHLGHVKMLEEAKSFGDVLVVALNSDESVKQLKGSGRPILSESERAEILSALKSVDFIVGFKEKRAINVLRALKPDIYVKGGDYNPETLHKGEKGLIERMGTKIMLSKKYGSFSTSNIISRISNGKKA